MKIDPRISQALSSFAMSSKPSIPEQTKLEIAFTHVPPSKEPIHKDSSHSTIIFLHGSESCHLEFSRVTPFLADYDILLVDLPGHSRSKEIPFSMKNAIITVSRLIKTKARAGKAHVVGLSFGGFIGLELARQCPELLLSLWCTGCAPFSGYRKWFVSHPRLLSGIVTMAGKIATERIFWASFGAGVQPIPGLREEVQQNQNLSTMRDVFTELSLVNMDQFSEIRGVRIAIIAGGKQDNVQDTKEVGRLLRGGNPECDAFVVRDAIHWWSIQLPEVFAMGVRAWIEGGDMPSVYEPLLSSASSGES